MKEPKILRGLLTILIIIAAMSASLSGPRYGQAGPLSNEPPPLEELIPPGTRKDSGFLLSVLNGNDIVSMTMERYLIGVLCAEMPASFEPEALKAQAVAARTNVMYNMNVAKKAKHPDADVCTDPNCCAAYRSDELLREKWGRNYVRYITKIIDAVVETDGICMSYEGSPICAFFHSSSAGKTETSGNVWVTDLPYLLCVSSPETAEDVPDFIVSVPVTRADFIDTVLTIYPDAVLDGSGESWISDITYTESGRILDLSIGGVTVKGTELRSMFGLRSTAVTISWYQGDIVFTTTGYGHGVGMSQYGANVMAADGKNFMEILNHYYSGITLNS